MLVRQQTKPPQQDLYSFVFAKEMTENLFQCVNWAKQLGGPLPSQVSHLMLVSAPEVQGGPVGGKLNYTQVHPDNTLHGEFGCYLLVQKK